MKRNKQRRRRLGIWDLIFIFFNAPVIYYLRIINKTFLYIYLSLIILCSVVFGLLISRKKFFCSDCKKEISFKWHFFVFNDWRKSQRKRIYKTIDEASYEIINAVCPECGSYSCGMKSKIKAERQADPSETIIFILIAIIDIIVKTKIPIGIIGFGLWSCSIIFKNASYSKRKFVCFNCDNRFNYRLTQIINISFWKVPGRFRGRREIDGEFYETIYIKCPECGAWNCGVNVPHPKNIKFPTVNKKDLLENYFRKR